MIIHRGQLGASKEEDRKVKEEKLPNGKEAEKSKKHEANNTQVKENVGGCCQGANGFSCCMNGSVDEKGTEIKAPSKLSSWIGSLEQRDVLTATAVIGAVATIAIAYSYYRRSG